MKGLFFMEAKSLGTVTGTGASLAALFGGTHSGVNSDGTNKGGVFAPEKRKKRKISRRVRELRERDGLDSRDLIGL